MEPIALALREITDTKRIVEELLVSSESFNYHQAKAALRALNQKLRQLGKVQSRLQNQQNKAVRAPNVCFVDFTGLSSQKSRA